MDVAVRDLKVGDMIQIWDTYEVVQTTEEWSWEADSFSLTFASDLSKSYAFAGFELHTLVSAAGTGPLPAWEADLIASLNSSPNISPNSMALKAAGHVAKPAEASIACKCNVCKPAEPVAEALEDGRPYRWVRADSLEGGDMIWRAGEDYMVDSVKVTGRPREFGAKLQIRFLGLDVVTYWFGDTQVQLITG